MNVTHFRIGDSDYIIFQNIAYLVMLLVGLLVNIVTIIVTIKTDKSHCCATSKLFLSSYVGNICSMTSLAVNGVYKNDEGVPNMMNQPEIDRHFFLFMGLTVNMTMLVNSTYNRYQGISNFKNKINSSDSNKNLFVRYTLPAWIVSAVVAISAVLFRYFYNKTHHFLVCEIICIIPILACIGLNILLKLFLIKMQKNAVATQQNLSLKNIAVAISMLRIITLCHIIYLIAGGLVFYFLEKYKENGDVFIALDWIIRILFYLTFTLEATIFLIKHSLARRLLLQLFKRPSQRKRSFSKSSVLSVVTETSVGM